MIGLRNGEVKERGIHLLLPLQMGWRKRLWKIKLAGGIHRGVKVSGVYLYNLMRIQTKGESCYDIAML
jgi:hypothetical protein